MSNLNRKRRLSVIAKADASLLAERWSTWCADHGEPSYEVLRKPEIGTAMVRGRTGSVGAAFNLGEITVTRSSVKLECGAVGHGYVQGRNKEQSIQAALIDALGQTSAGATIDRAIIEPLAATASDRSLARAQKAAATKVDFFTLARGHS